MTHDWIWLTKRSAYCGRPVTIVHTTGAESHGDFVEAGGGKGAGVPPKGDAALGGNESDPARPRGAGSHQENATCLCILVAFSSGKHRYLGGCCKGKTMARPHRRNPYLRRAMLRRRCGRAGQTGRRPGLRAWR
jgi:hypothetical protein